MRWIGVWVVLAAGLLAGVPEPDETAGLPAQTTVQANAAAPQGRPCWACQLPYDAKRFAEEMRQLRGVSGQADNAVHPNWIPATPGGISCCNNGDSGRRNTIKALAALAAGAAGRAGQGRCGVPFKAAGDQLPGMSRSLSH